MKTNKNKTEVVSPFLGALGAKRPLWAAGAVVAVVFDFICSLHRIAQTVCQEDLVNSDGA